jgi:hypothetical protein
MMAAGFLASPSKQLLRLAVVLNVVFIGDDAGKIRRLDVFMQKAP